MARDISRQTTTIANGATTSAAVTLDRQRTLLGFFTPAALTGTTFTFSASIDADGTSYMPVYNAGTEYSVTVGTSRYVSINTEVFHGIKLFKIISGSSEAASRTITVVSGEVQ